MPASGQLVASLDPRVDALRRLALFHDTRRWTLSELAQRVTEVEVAADTDIVRQGEEADDFLATAAHAGLSNALSESVRIRVETTATRSAPTTV